jgi:hypothetical protein
MEVNSMENNNNVENNESKVTDPAEIQKNKVKEITDNSSLVSGTLRFREVRDLA